MTDIHVRLPDEVAEAMRAAAAEDARTLNSMLVVALREWLASRKRKR